MLTNEKNAFASLLEAVFGTYESKLAKPVSEIWWNALSPFELADIRIAFGQHVNGREGKFTPRPAHILQYLDAMNPDGRPTPDEAWAMIPRSESESVVMTEEMAEAMRYAQPLLDCNDQVAARRAFLDAYSRIVEKNKLTGIPPKWFPSLGDDKNGRGAALAEAVRLGRIEAAHAVSLMPPDKVSAMLQLAGKRVSEPRLTEKTTIRMELPNGNASRNG